eukprot:417382-Alexandrium_andersonii.AAC.1
MVAAGDRGHQQRLLAPVPGPGPRPSHGPPGMLRRSREPPRGEAPGCWRRKEGPGWPTSPPMFWAGNGTTEDGDVESQPGPRGQALGAPSDNEEDSPTRSRQAWIRDLTADGDVESQPGPRWRLQGRTRHADRLLPDSSGEGTDPLGRLLSTADAVL